MCGWPSSRRSPTRVWSPHHGCGCGPGSNSAPERCRQSGCLQALANRRLLLILDTCEHVIDAAAIMAEALLRTGSGVRIIATSREPLRVEGEQIYHVPPLAVPVAEGEDPWRFGAVLLFVVRARAQAGRTSPRINASHP